MVNQNQNRQNETRGTQNERENRPNQGRDKEQQKDSHKGKTK